METIGKILSLTLLAIFGTAGTIIYFTDTGPSSPVIWESVKESRNAEREPQTDIDYAAYREKLRRGFIENKAPRETNSTPREENALWKNTYDSSSEVVKRLSIEISYSQLLENVRFWNNEYHEALRLGNKEAADVAYARHRDYKEALDMKSALR